MRGGDYFVAPTREIDPFYTLGYLHRKGQWALVINDTLVTNFRHPPFNDSVPQQSNVSMIADIEVNHPISRCFPALLAFIRAEPIWNWDSHKAAGISGFDFRFYGGLRLTISKPSYYGQMDDLRNQIKESDKSQPTGASPGDSTSVNPGNSNSTGSDNTNTGNNSSSDNSTSNMPGDPKLKGL